MSIAWRIRSAHTERHTPEGWKVRRIGDLVRLTNGYPFPSDSFAPSGDMPLVRIRELVTHVDEFSTYVSGYVPRECILDNEDIVIGMDGDFNVVRWNRGKAALNQRLCRLRPRPGVDIRFIGYALPSILGIINDLTFSTTVKHLSSPDILSERLPLPPLDEQRRIADFLDSETARIDHLANLRRDQINLLEARYTSAISELVTPGITTSDTRNALWPWLPSAIRTARLGYMARVQSGVTVDSGRQSTPDDVEYPYLRVANVQGEEVDLSEVKTISIPSSIARRAKLYPGDVVMTEANGNPDNLGRGAVWHGEISDMIHQNHIFAIRVDSHKLVPEYLSALLASTHGRRYFRFTSTQVGIATTSSAKVLDFPVPTLTVEQQINIASSYKGIRAANRQAITVLARQLDLLSERRQALVTAAVTGEIDVTTAGGITA